MKTTFKHIVDGTVFTRQTARAYTHVVLAKTNVEASVQFIEKHCAGWIKQAKKNAEFDWDHAAYNSTASVGEPSFFKQYTLTQHQKHEAEAFFGKYGTLTRDQYIDQKVQTERDRLSAKIEALQTTDHQWVAAAWSGSLSNAWKAAAGYHYDYTRVEAINNGVAA